MRESSAFGFARLVKAHARGLLLVLLVTLGVVALAVLIVMQSRAADARDEALRWQSLSYDAMIRAQAVSGTVATAEATLGRYVISLEQALGRRYVDQWRQAGNQIDTLNRVLSIGGGTEDDDIARLRAAYAKRGKELAQIASYSNSKRSSMAALSLYYQRRDTAALRDLNATLNHIIDREHARLVDRSAAARRAVDQSNLATRLLTLFGALLVAGVSLLGWLTAQSSAERAAADAEVLTERERAAELSAAVDAATVQLREEAQERAHAEARLRQVQKMDAIGQLTGGIAHDFNNMLAVVLGGLELAKRRLQAGEDGVERHIDNAIEGTNRAAALTRRLLAFARAEPLRPEAIDVGSLILGMSDLLDRALGDAIAVRVSTSNPGWRIWVDSHQLENAILNLAVNARDAMSGRGVITIAAGTAVLEAGTVGTCAAGEYVTVTVVDSGHGMAPEVLERVFEPFFTTKPVGKGTGLGLSQIFAFARQSEGEIAIASTLGQGTTVTLYLPRHQHAGAALPAPVAPPSEPITLGRQGLKVLIVEDDPRVRALTVGAIQELGHRAIPCADPQHVAAKIDETGTPDLILTDVLMPGLSGPEMIAALGDRIAGVAVLFVTGFTGDAAADMLAGHRLLRKPFTLAGLARAINETMAEQRNARETVE